MRFLCKIHSCLVFSLLPFIAAVLLLQTNSPNGFFSVYFPLSSSPSLISSSSSWSWTIRRHLDPIFSSSSSPPLSRTEEKRQRAKKRLSDAVDEVLAWRRRDERSDEKLQSLEKGLANARAFIREGLGIQNDTVSSPSNSSEFNLTLDYVPTGSIYNNATAFHRSYSLMEKVFKIFVYEEGEPPIFHHGPCKNIYSIEGLFINLMDKDVHFRTQDPDQAHAFFLPFSVVMILEHLFDPIFHHGPCKNIYSIEGLFINLMDKDVHFKTQDPDQAHAFFLPFSVVMILEHLFDPVIRDKAVLERTVVDYVNTISTKYPYWNRSIGVDHFMLSCHDWGPRATWYHPLLYFHSIRVLCNANTSEHYNPKKDASIPEINLPTGDITGFLEEEETLSPTNRSILGFFAGRMHGRIRPTLLSHWKEKDKDIQIYEHLPEGVSYDSMMRSSKYCICPSGFEVASPRIVEAIYVGCVPVLISQDYVLPFSDVLDWDSFSVRVSVEEIPNLKRILMGISEESYLRMHENVKQVQRHFVVNDPPKRYDVFHMILHSIWLRRLNVRINS